MIKLEFYKNDYYECTELIGVYTKSKTMREHLKRHMEKRYMDNWTRDKLLDKFDNLDFSNVNELFKGGFVKLSSGLYVIYLEPLKLNESYSEY